MHLVLSNGSTLRIGRAPRACIGRFTRLRAAEGYRGPQALPYAFEGRAPRYVHDVAPNLHVGLEQAAFGQNDLPIVRGSASWTKVSRRSLPTIEPGVDLL